MEENDRTCCGMIILRLLNNEIREVHIDWLNERAIEGVGMWQSNGRDQNAKDGSGRAPVLREDLNVLF
jgi:hypothetical protein